MDSWFRRSSPSYFERENTFDKKKYLSDQSLELTAMLQIDPGNLLGEVQFNFQIVSGCKCFSPANIRRGIAKRANFFLDRLEIVTSKRSGGLDTGINYCQSKWRLLLRVAKWILKKMPAE